MTFRIKPEFDREGRAVCQSWLPGGKHNVTPSDRRSVRRESPWGPPDPPSPKRVARWCRERGGRCVRTSGHVTGYFAGGSHEGLQRARQTMLFLDYHLAKLNPNCHMNYLDYL